MGIIDKLQRPPSRSLHMTSGEWHAQAEEVRKDFLAPHGDRRQELVFIGTHLHQPAIEAALNKCLCLPSEMDQVTKRSACADIKELIEYPVSANDCGSRPVLLHRIRADPTSPGESRHDGANGAMQAAGKNHPLGEGSVGWRHINGLKLGDEGPTH